MGSEEVKIYEGSVTLELHGYLADLKVNCPQKRILKAVTMIWGKPFLNRESILPESAKPSSMKVSSQCVIKSNLGTKSFYSPLRSDKSKDENHGKSRKITREGKEYSP